MTRVDSVGSVDSAKPKWIPKSQLTDSEKSTAIINLINDICERATSSYINALCCLNATESGKRVWEEEMKKEVFLGISPRCPYNPESSKKEMEAAKAKMDEWKDIVMFATETFINTILIIS